jgi:hypothetical protein
MSNPFSKPSEFAGGAFFKPGDHMTDLALLLEPKAIDKEVKSEYKGNVRYRDEVTCDISVFATSESLDKGEPTTIMKNCRVVHGMLTSTIERIIGGAMVATVTKVSTKAGEGYVFRDVNPDTESKVGAYFSKRAEEVAANLDAAPGFDD